jgi:hypothetical protein
MIISFPSSCIQFEANRDITKGELASSSPSIGFNLVMTAPINIKRSDSIIIDTHTGKVEIIRRAGFAIYRDAWKN